MIRKTWPESNETVCVNCGERYGDHYGLCCGPYYDKETWAWDDGQDEDAKPVLTWRLHPSGNWWQVVSMDEEGEEVISAEVSSETNTAWRAERRWQIYRGDSDACWKDEGPAQTVLEGQLAAEEALRKVRPDLFDGIEVFVKHDADKPATGLLPPRAVLSVSEVLAHGAAKYSADNWRKSPNVRRYPAAALRHIFQYLSGEDIDPDSGKPNLAHAAASLLFQLELDLLGRPGQEDDRIV